MFNSQKGLSTCLAQSPLTGQWNNPPKTLLVLDTKCAVDKHMIKHRKEVADVWGFINGIGQDVHSLTPRKS